MNKSYNNDYNKSEEKEPIYDRLYKIGVEKRNKRYPSLNERDLKECTFAPQLIYLNSDSYIEGNINDFLERQKLYEDLKHQRKQRHLSRSAERKRYTFTPKINLTSEILMKADTKRLQETSEDKIQRLYKINNEKIKQHKEQLSEVYYSQYDFKPKINEVSKYLGRDCNLSTLVNNTKKENCSKTNRLNESLKKEEMLNCTFIPKTNKDKYTNIYSNYKQDDNLLKKINDELNYKQTKIEEIKT